MFREDHQRERMAVSLELIACTLVKIQQHLADPNDLTPEDRQMLKDALARMQSSSANLAAAVAADTVPPASKV